MRVILFILLFISIIGCSKNVRTEASMPIYALPNLLPEQKANYLESRIDAWCLDDDGFLLWRCYLQPDGLGGWVKGNNSDLWWQPSYNVADFPAWQGQYISGLAYRWAVTGQNNEAKILKAINGLFTCYTASGVEGLLVRSYFKYNGNMHLNWMKTYEEAKEEDDLDQGYWQKGKNGYWFRNAVAGGHHQGVFTAMCVLGALQQQGRIQLSVLGQQKVKNFLTPLYHRLRNNNYNIVDFDGKVTGFGYMQVYGFNSQYALWHLTLNKAAMLWGIPAPNGQNTPQEEYEKKIKSYAPIIDNVFTGLAIAMGPFDINDRFYKFNDIHWSFHAWMALVVSEQNYKDEMKQIMRGFEALESISDPFNVHNYIIATAGGIKVSSEKTQQAFDAITWYPAVKFGFAQQNIIETEKWQPIQNRKICTSYWKGEPFKRATMGEHTNTQRCNQYRCGFDFVLAYWMGRYFDIIKP